MLRVELDIYSGMPNPTWTLTDPEEQELLDRIVAQPTLMRSADSAPAVLGYRGFFVSVEKEDDGAWTKAAKAMAGQLEVSDANADKVKAAFANGISLPTTFRIGTLDPTQASVVAGDGSTDASAWLLNTSEKPDSSVDDFLREVAKGTIDLAAVVTATALEETEAAVSPAGLGMTCSSNYYTGTDYSAWNSSYYVTRNNCYCFGSNHRANIRYASPGKRTLGYFPGLSYTQMRTGLFADGWRDSCVAARNLSIACVVWPNYDFHFYRKVNSSGVWGHKPGGTPAKSTDNSGRVIYNPQTCNRGYYTSWYGYYYQDNNTAYVA
ncbi:MAG: hypothetical protein ACOYNY_06170 [Caldilineaceae bacterium]